MADNMKFAERLESILQKTGFSQADLSRRAGLSRQAVSSLLQGINEPSWETVQRLAAALGVDCRAFADPALSHPVDAAPARPRGRPRKEEAPPEPAPKPRRGKRK